MSWVCRGGSHGLVEGGDRIHYPGSLSPLRLPTLRPKPPTPTPTPTPLTPCSSHPITRRWSGDIQGDFPTLELQIKGLQQVAMSGIALWTTGAWRAGPPVGAVRSSRVAPPRRPMGCVAIESQPIKHSQCPPPCFSPRRHWRLLGLGRPDGPTVVRRWVSGCPAPAERGALSVRMVPSPPSGVGDPAPEICVPPAPPQRAVRASRHHLSHPQARAHHALVPVWRLLPPVPPARVRSTRRNAVAEVAAAAVVGESSATVEGFLLFHSLNHHHLLTTHSVPWPSAGTARGARRPTSAGAPTATTRSGASCPRAGRITRRS